MKRIASVALLSTALSWVACSSSNATSPTPPAADAGPGEEAAAIASPVTLAPGEVAEVTFAGNTAAAHIPTSGGEKLMVVLASTKLDVSSATTFAYSIAANATDDAAETGAHKLDECSLAKWDGAAPIDDPAPTGSAPSVGATKSISMSTGIASETITVKAVAVGPRAIVWVDTTPAHPASLDDAFVTQFLSDFETIILPRERAVFGTESDQDGDGRVSLVFTPLTKNTGVAFFTGCDLAQMSGCKGGNHGEYLYLTPPADIDPPYNTPAAIKETLAHECGHLVHFSRKVLKNQLTTWPDSSYMIEGFGGFAQDVIGYQAGNFYVAQAGLDQIDAFSLADVLGTREDYDAKRDGVLRGGGYWFVRWLYDRGGSDAMGSDGAIANQGGPSLVRALLDAPASVADGVSARAKDKGASMADVVADFYTALAASNESEADKAFADPKNGCFAFAKTDTDPLTTRVRGGDPHASFHGQAMKGPASKALASADGKLRAGGAEFLTVDVPAGQTQLVLRAQVDAVAAARLRVVRLK